MRARYDPFPSFCTKVPDKRVDRGRIWPLSTALQGRNYREPPASASHDRTSRVLSVVIAHAPSART